MNGLYLFCVGVVVLGLASRGYGYSTYPRRYNRDSVWGTCPQHCRCMTLNSRGTRGLLDTWGEEQVSEKTLKYFSGGINDEAARNGRSMVCQGLRTLPDPIPAGKGVNQINRLKLYRKILLGRYFLFRNHCCFSIYFYNLNCFSL